MKIALPREYFEMDMDNRLKDEINKSIKLLEDLGANIEEISLPNIKDGLATYYTISTAEISSNMARFDGIRYGYRAKDYETLDELYMNTRREAFGEEVKRRIIMGTYFLSSGQADDYYKKALKVRTIIKKDFDKAFKKYDIILSPTSPKLPFKIGENIDDPLKMYKSIYSLYQSIYLSICALSIPCGDIEGLPVGLQLIGDRFKEINILKAAYALEKNLSLGVLNNGI